MLRTTTRIRAAICAAASALCAAAAADAGAAPVGPPQEATDCSVKIGYPHKSSHVPGTINVEAFASCAGTPGGQQQVSVTLFLVNTDTKKASAPGVGSKPVTNGQSNVLITNAATPDCVTGNYIGVGTGLAIGLPPGKWNPPGTLLPAFRSEQRFVRCD